MLRLTEEVSEFVISGEGSVLDVGLQPQHIAQADFGEPDDVVVLVLSPGNVAKLRVAGQALLGALPAAELHPALVNGAAGVVITVRGRPYAVMGFTVADGKIIEIDAIADPDRVSRIATAVLSNE